MTHVIRMPYTPHPLQFRENGAELSAGQFQFRRQLFASRFFEFSRFCWFFFRLLLLTLFTLRFTRFLSPPYWFYAVSCVSFVCRFFGRPCLLQKAVTTVTIDDSSFRLIVSGCFWNRRKVSIRTGAATYRKTTTTTTSMTTRLSKSESEFWQVAEKLSGSNGKSIANENKTTKKHAKKKRLKLSQMARHERQPIPIAPSSFNSANSARLHTFTCANWMCWQNAGGGNERTVVGSKNTGAN